MIRSAIEFIIDVQEFGPLPLREGTVFVYSPVLVFKVLSLSWLIVKSPYFDNDNAIIGLRNSSCNKLQPLPQSISDGCSISWVFDICHVHILNKTSTLSIQHALTLCFSFRNALAYSLNF